MRTMIFAVLGVLQALVGASCVSAQGTPGAQAGTMQPGLVLVAKVAGTAKIDSAGVVGDLKIDDSVRPGSVITTGENSRLVLAFSNGAVVSLGSNTEIVIQEFVMQPFGGTVRLNELTEEPTVSRTVIRLNRGELVGNVKKLHADRGSSFTVQTPVGAAGIRGTMFRIVFRPGGTGRMSFSLSTVQGLVGFQPLSAPASTGTGSVTGLLVPAGQQIVVEVSVTNTATGQMSVVASPLPAQPHPIPPAVMQQIAIVAAQMGASTGQAISAPTPGSNFQSVPAPRPPATPQRRSAPAPGAPPAKSSAKPADLPMGPLSLVEAIRFFEGWGGHAVWADELTEFAIDSRAPSGGVLRQYFEVQRDGAAFSLREISGLTRPLIDHGLQVLPPLNFTETAEMNAAYYRANPGAVPGQLTIPPGGPYPRTPIPPQPGAVKNAAGSNVAGEAAGTPASQAITINGVTSSGASFTGTVTVTPAAPTPTSTPPPPPQPLRAVPPPEAPPRKTNPGG